MVNQQVRNLTPTPKPSIIDVEASGVYVATEPALNFIAGSSISLTIADNPSNQRVDITVNSTGGVTFANPTALVGLTAVNGVATTAMRSDAAPALDQSITPNWTGAHVWGTALNSTNVHIDSSQIAFLDNVDGTNLHFTWSIFSVNHTVNLPDNSGILCVVATSPLALDGATGTMSLTTVPINLGGTGQITANAAYNALSPMTTLGDIEYEDATPKAVRLAGNITTTKKFLRQTGTGAISAAPAWDTVLPADIGGLTSGSVLFAGASGTISQDNAKFFWDDTNFRLGIGIIPAFALDIVGTIRQQNSTNPTYIFANTSLAVENRTFIILKDTTRIFTFRNLAASQLANATDTAYSFRDTTDVTDMVGVTRNGYITSNSIAATAGSPSVITVTAPAHTTLAIAEVTDINFNLARTVNFTSGGGTVTNQRATLVQSPTYTATTNAVTLTNAATFAVTGAPSAGTNVTITNPYSIWSQAGTVRVDGTLNVSGNAVISGTPTGFLVQQTYQPSFSGTPTSQVGGLIQTVAVTDSSANTISIYGIQNTVTYTGAGNNTSGSGIVAGYFDAHNLSTTATVSNAFAVEAFVGNFNAGIVTTAYMYYGLLEAQNGTISTFYGLYLDSSISGTVTTRWGVYVKDSTFNNYFAGNVSIGSTTTTSLLNLGSSAQTQVNTSGVAVKYNNFLTVLQGIPSVLAEIDLVNQSSTIAATLLYAVPATGAGRYRISYIATVTRAATTSSTLGAFQVQYTDNDTSVTKTLPGTVAAGVDTNTINATINSTVSRSLTVFAKASTNINYLMGYVSSGATTMQYNLHIVLEYLG